MNQKHVTEFTSIPAKTQNGNHVEELERAHASRVSDSQTLARLGKKQVLKTTITSAGFLAGGIIKGLLILNHPDQTFHQWQATLIGYGVIVVAVFINTVVSSYLPSVESCTLVIHILGFFAILIVVAHMGPHSSAKDVFINWSNGGNWPSQGTSFMVGLTGNVFAFAGK
ncbi:MAG: hypothetical protein Q9157_002161 [Trypethelium eluteriae]